MSFTVTRLVPPFVVLPIRFTLAAVERTSQAPVLARTKQRVDETPATWTRFRCECPKETNKMPEKKYLKESIKLGDKDLTVETGKVAKQADGSVIIRYGDTMLLVAAVGALTPREGVDFFPLTVEYRESNYAAGRIPGNYFRREGRP